MLGCNEYRITGCSELSNEETKSLVLLYHEITKQQAIYLYSLMVYQEKTAFRKLSELLVELNYSLDVFEELIEDLEIVGLVDTYQNHNQLIFVVKKPKLYAELIHDEVYGRLLLKKVGNEHYQYLVSLMKPAINLDGFEKVNHSLNSDLLINWNQNQEVIFNNVAELKAENETSINSIFDMRHFLKSVSNTLFPLPLRTFENLTLIAELADTYGIDENLMRQFINKSVKISPLSFDTKYLKQLCLNGQSSNNQVNENANPYHMSNVAFLEKLQGVPPTYNDKILIARLVEDCHLNTEVINVLLEYAYNECKKQLIPSFISSVGSNWYRNHIDTQEKALNQITETRNYNRNKVSNHKKIEQVPEYTSTNNIDIPEELMEKYFGKK